MICAFVCCFGIVSSISADETLIPGKNHSAGLDTNPFDNPLSFISQSTDALSKIRYEKNTQGVQRLENTLDAGPLQKGAWVYKNTLSTSDDFSFSGDLYQHYFDFLIRNIFNGFTLTDSNPSDFLDAHDIKTGFGNDRSTWQASMGFSKVSLNTQKEDKFLITMNGTLKENLYEELLAPPNMKDETSLFDLTTRINVAKIKVQYTANDRQLTVNIDSAKGPNIQSTAIPSNVKELTLGYINIGNTNRDIRVSGIENINANILPNKERLVKTSVLYKNTRGEQLGLKSTILSYTGEKISIFGNYDSNFIAPSFNGYTVRKDKHEIVAKKDGQLVVTYDFNPQEIPVKIIDEDDLTNKLPESKFKVMPYVVYNMSDDVAKTYIPKNYDFIEVKKREGVIQVGTNGEISVKVIPIEIHVKHSLRTDKKTYVRNIKFVPAPSVVGNFPATIKQTCHQDVLVDLITNKIVKRMGDLSFPGVNVPEVSGYEPGVLKVPEAKIDDSTQATSTIEVLYYYLTQLNVPKQLIFRPIMVGSLEYYGIRPTKLEKVDGSLDLIAGNPTLNKWEVSVQADSKYKSAMFNINGKNVAIGESQVVYEIDKHKDEKIVSLLSDKDKDVVSLKVKNDKSEALAGDKQNYTLTWSLRNVPV